MVKTGITLNPSMMMKVIFCGMINAVGLVSENHTCLTWDIKDYMLILQCRTGGFGEPVSFVDPAGIIQAKCSFNQECKSLHRNGKITGEYAQNKVIFSIDNIIPQYVNGKWTCVQGSIESSTNVSTTKGIIASTNVYLVGKFIDTNKIKLTCSSCREPEGNYAEFYINENSFASVLYNHETGKCQQGTQECSPEKCSCSLSGNDFTLVLQINKETKEYPYACEMRFTDTVQHYKFLQVSTVYINGTNLFSNGTVTRITKSAENEFIPPKYSKTLTKLNATESSIQKTTTVIPRIIKDSETDTKGPEMLILITVLSALLFGFFVALIYCKLRRRKSKPHEDLAEEKTLLKSQISEKNSCDPCSVRKLNLNVKAVHWCMECHESLCSECQTFHKALKICRNHKIVPLDEVPSNYMSTNLYCSKHTDLNYDYPCQDHHKLCCTECLRYVHYDCKTIQTLQSFDTKTRVKILLEKCFSNVYKLIDDQKTAFARDMDVIGDDVNYIKICLSRLSDETSQHKDSMFKQRENIEILRTQLESAKDMYISKTKIITTTLDESVKVMNNLKQDLIRVRENGYEYLLFLYIYLSTKTLLLDKQSQIQKIISDPKAIRLQYQSCVGAIGSIEIKDPSLKPVRPSPFQVPVKCESISTD